MQGSLGDVDALGYFHAGGEGEGCSGWVEAAEMEDLVTG